MTTRAAKCPGRLHDGTPGTPCPHVWDMDELAEFVVLECPRCHGWITAHKERVPEIRLALAQYFSRGKA